MSKKLTIAQRRSLAAKKGWETRRKKHWGDVWATFGWDKPAPAPEPDVSFEAYRERTEGKRDADLNALSNGPPNIERDTDYSPGEIVRVPLPPTPPSIWQRLKAWWST